MMPFLNANLSILIALILYVPIHFFNMWIHKKARYFILGALILSILVIFIDVPLLSFIMDSGHLSLAFFILIMFAGVMVKSWVPYKKILLVRGDLAIIGFIFLIPHGINRLSLALSGYNMSGLFAAIIMLPLTISSFITIRKNIRPDRWKKLHKLAYVAYFLIYIHLGFDIFLDSTYGYVNFSPNSILFHILILIYIGLKIMRMKQKKVQLKTS
jgi:DMSO/TMAO reductase YedYZ heme-binding membrane subunit